MNSKLMRIAGVLGAGVLFGSGCDFGGGNVAIWAGVGIGALVLLGVLQPQAQTT